MTCKMGCRAPSKSQLDRLQKKPSSLSAVAYL